MPRRRAPKTKTESAPREALLQMTNAYMISQALYVAAKLGIADLLKGGPKTVRDMASSSGVDEFSLYRFLRTLASEGVFCELDDQCFTLTPMAELLRADATGSLRGWAIFRGEPFVWKPYGELLNSVRTGRPAFDHVFGMPVFQYFENNPDAAAIFDEAMRSVSAQKYHAVADAYDFSAIKTLVDVGGGNGGMLTAILSKYARLKGILSELPHVVEGARKRIQAAGLAARCECVEVDMFKSVPAGGDAYIMGNVIHDWDEERSVLILQNCCRAMVDGGKVLLVELVLSPRNEPHLSKLADVEMLVMTEGGKERTEDECGQLFEAANLRLSRIVPTESPWSVIEGVVV